jgi:phosphate starvation-inducible PhoH-like protein
MKMFLTRMGFGSKVVVTGDVTQIDLPPGKKSGLKEAVSILENIEDIGISILTPKDVVRNPLVQKIIMAYAAFDTKRQRQESKPVNRKEKFKKKF